MNEPAQGPGLEAGPAGLPKQTTPTWEVELLISGVAVFAMVQLPGLLDDAIFHLRPRFSENWAAPLWMFYVYAKTAAVILAATFIIHLLLRARWIALVGLLSVHPEGIDWSRMRMGPIAREIEQRRMGNLDAAVDRADNRATTVFATGVTLASLLIVVAIVAVTLMALLSGFGGPSRSQALLVLIAAFVGPFAVAQALDRKYGAGLAEGSGGRRLLRGVLEAYSRVGFGVARSPAIALMSSSGGRRRVTLLIMGIMMLAVIAVSGSYYLMREPGSMGSFALFPQARGTDGGAILPAHYDDQRDPARDRPLPHIQSAVVTDPYLRLVVPYLPARDEAVLRNTCPGLESLQDDARRSAARGCLQRMFPATLDGKPLPLPLESGVDARTGQPALVAMIDVRTLARGRHELTVAEPADADAGTEPPQPQRIPFWR
jgi:hypothetical protein